MELISVLQNIANAIRKTKYGIESVDVDDTQKINAQDMSGEIFTIAESYFTSSMCDGDGRGLRNVEAITIDCAEVHSLSSSAFEAMKNLKEVHFDNSKEGSSFTSIGGSCFSNCVSLSKIDIIEGVEAIGDKAFEMCAMEEIRIPSSVIDIQGNPFRNNAKLASIKVDENNTVYTSKNNKGDECYAIISRGYSKLIKGSNATEDISGIVTIGTYAFAQNTINSITIPSSVTSMENAAFSQCIITDISFEEPSTLKTLGVQCFYQVKNLKNLSLPDSIESIGQNSFNYAVSLESITLPNNLSIIEKLICTNCQKLEYVSMPAYVTEIQSAAFKGCGNLTLVDFSKYEGSAPPILTNSDAFSGTNANMEIKVPSSLLNDWKTADNWMVYADKIVAYKS